MHRPRAQEGRLIYLYLDDQLVVWGEGFDGHGALARLEGGWQEIRDRLQREDTCCVRVLALRRHASLLTKLYEHFRQQHRLEIATPRVVGQETDPRVVWVKMQQCAILSASLGGWRPMVEEDYCSQVLTRDAGRGWSYWELPGHLRKCLHKHPVWHDLWFITDIQETDASVVLAYISDPRWWIDPYHPDRLSSLHSFFRLFPAGARAVESHYRDKHSEAWRDKYDARGYVRMEWLAAMFGYPFKLDEQKAREPGGFLARRYLATHDAKGLLSACRTALRYIVCMWRAELARRYRPEQHRELFVPQYFFSGEELEAYLAHHAKRPGCPSA